MADLRGKKGFRTENGKTKIYLEGLYIGTETLALAPASDPTCAGDVVVVNVFRLVVRQRQHYPTHVESNSQRVIYEYKNAAGSNPVTFALETGIGTGLSGDRHFLLQVV